MTDLASQTNMQSTIKIFSSAEYFDEIVRMIAGTSAGDQVAIATMTFDPTVQSVQRVLKELAAAGSRGVDVTLLLDARPFLYQEELGLGPLFYSAKLPNPLPSKYQNIQKTLDKLNSCSVKYNIINRPSRSFTNPHGGRSHIKFAVINDYVCVGGVNLDNDANIDLMVGMADKSFAKYLLQLASKILISGSVRRALHDKDVAIDLGPNTKVYLDSGVSGQSLIFEKALEFIDSAREHIFFTCQHFPSGKIGRHLLAAHRRGVRVEIYSNRPNKNVWPYNILHYGAVQVARRQLPSGFFRNMLDANSEYLHAKLIASETGAMIGSHNYLGIGVQFGTAELTLACHDPNFSKRAIEAVSRQMVPKHYVS
jgi:phosphatidylserine/phosphatidylglycerophosphate/cardiolipin synthase-like enzyme